MYTLILLLSLLVHLAIADLPSRGQLTRIAPEAYSKPGVQGAAFYLYVPKNLSPNPAVVVAIHQCTGTAPAYFRESPYGRASEEYGFIGVYPGSPHEGRCWDVSSNNTLTHGKGSDSEAIVRMVRWVLGNYLEVDRRRVFMVGSSSGAMMVNVLAGAYPDYFSAGIAYSGVPAGCFVNVNNEVNAWNSTCSQGNSTASPEHWASIVRSMDYGYHESRPRMLIYHGGRDRTISPRNYVETTKQWSGVFGYDYVEAARSRRETDGYISTTWGPDLKGMFAEEGTHQLKQLVGFDMAWFGLNSSSGFGDGPRAGDGGRSGEGGREGERTRGGEGEATGRRGGDRTGTRGITLTRGGESTFTSTFTTTRGSRSTDSRGSASSPTRGVDGAQGAGGIQAPDGWASVWQEGRSTTSGSQSASTFTTTSENTPTSRPSETLYTETSSSLSVESTSTQSNDNMSISSSDGMSATSVGITVIQSTESATTSTETKESTETPTSPITAWPTGPWGSTLRTETAKTSDGKNRRTTTFRNGVTVTLTLPQLSTSLPFTSNMPDETFAWSTRRSSNPWSASTMSSSAPSRSSTTPNFWSSSSRFTRPSRSSSARTDEWSSRSAWPSPSPSSLSGGWASSSLSTFSSEWSVAGTSTFSGERSSGRPSTLSDAWPSPSLSSLSSEPSHSNSSDVSQDVPQITTTSSAREPPLFSNSARLPENDTRSPSTPGTRTSWVSKTITRATTSHSLAGPFTSAGPRSAGSINSNTPRPQASSGVASLSHSFGPAYEAVVEVQSSTSISWVSTTISPPSTEPPTSLHGSFSSSAYRTERVPVWKPALSITRSHLGTWPQPSAQSSFANSSRVSSTSEVFLLTNG